MHYHDLGLLGMRHQVVLKRQIKKKPTWIKIRRLKMKKRNKQKMDEYNALPPRRSLVRLGGLPCVFLNDLEYSVNEKCNTF